MITDFSIILQSYPPLLLIKTVAAYIRPCHDLSTSLTGQEVIGYIYYTTHHQTQGKNAPRSQFQTFDSTIRLILLKKKHFTVNLRLSVFVRFSDNRLIIYFIEYE